MLSLFLSPNLVFLHPGSCCLWLASCVFKKEDTRLCTYPSVLTGHHHTVDVHVSRPLVKRIRLCSVGCLLRSLEPWPPCPPETSSDRSGNQDEICGEKNTSVKSSALWSACFQQHLFTHYDFLKWYNILWLFLITYYTMTFLKWHNILWLFKMTYYTMTFYNDILYYDFFSTYYTMTFLKRHTILWLLKRHTILWLFKTTYYTMTFLKLHTILWLF